MEFYYGSTLDFNGFIKAEEFSNTWEPGPRMIELPVVSPLGLASGTTFDWTQFNPPSWLSIRRVIRDSFDALDGDYTQFYFPHYIQSALQTELDYIVTALFINSLLICPWGGTYNKESSNMDGIYKAKTVEDALTLICTCFGLILHDIPDAPIFQRVDYTSDYVLLGLTSGRTRVTQDTTNLTTIANIASNECMESVVNPLSRIEVTYEGSQDVPEMKFDRCRGYSRGCGIPDKEFCSNSPNISDFDGSFDTAVSIDVNGLCTEGKIILGAYGGGGLSEMVIYRPASNWGTGKKLFSYTFFEWDGRATRLQFKHKYGTSIEDMDNPDNSGTYSTIAVIIKTGDRYYNETYGWQAIPSTLIYTRSWPDGRVDIEIGITAYEYAMPKPLVVEFYAASGNRTEWINTISDVRLANNQTASYAYLKKNATPTSYTIEGSPSDVEGDLSRGCGCWCPTLNRVRINGAAITGTMENDILDLEPKYPYLIIPQDRLELDVKMTSYPSAETLYLNRLTLWGNSGKWRTIARGFRPWDDVHHLTFHHSTVFD